MSPRARVFIRALEGPCVFGVPSSRVGPLKPKEGGGLDGNDGPGPGRAPVHTVKKLQRPCRHIEMSPGLVTVPVIVDTCEVSSFVLCLVYGFSPFRSVGSQERVEEGRGVGRSDWSLGKKCLSLHTRWTPGRNPPFGQKRTAVQGTILRLPSYSHSRRPQTGVSSERSSAPSFVLSHGRGLRSLG